VKDICHLQRVLSHFFFLLNKCDSLLRNVGTHELVLTWSSTSLCLGHLALLGQYNDQPHCLQVFYTWTASLFHITSYI